jgi:photosystem II stability/assembly factor-like uncharacterized protein
LNIVLRYFWRHSRAVTTTVLVGLLAIGSAAAAGESVSPQGKIVALDFDVGSRALIKAYPGTLYRSGNEGRDWEPIALPKAIARGRISSISVSAKGRGVLYVAGPGFGVLRSADGGRSWTAINHGLPSNDIMALSTHADQPKTLYVLVAGHGIFRSEDAGGHWRLMDAGPRAKVLQFVHSNMPGSMQTGWFFAATARGVSRSMDCFCGWRDAGGLGRAVTAVAYEPTRPKEIYAAAENALFFSADGGEQWSRRQSPGHDISALVVTPAGTLYAAVGAGELLRSADGGMTWHHVND